MPSLKTLFHTKKTIVIQKPLKMPSGSSEYEDKKCHMKGIVVYDQMSHSVKSNRFLFDCAHCHLPNTVHPTKLHSRKAIVSLSTSKMPLASLANEN